MNEPVHGKQCAAWSDVDVSTPEALEALSVLPELILEIRDEFAGPLARKVALYERTLGLAVVPVLVKRGLILLGWKLRRRRRDA